MAVNFNPASLTQYVEERREPLIQKAVVMGKTLDLINIQTGVKGSAAINMLSTDVTFGDGSACGWEEDGEQTLSQRIINAAQIKVNLAFCAKELMKTWMQYALRASVRGEEVNGEYIAEHFIEGVIKDIKAKLEKAIWQGDTASQDSNLVHFDGLLKIMATDVPAGNQLTGGADARDAIEKAYAAIPVEVLDKAAIFVGQDTFRDYVMALGADNLYHYNPQVDGEFTVMMPNTTTPVYGVAGLNGTKTVVAANPEHLFYGTDLEGDEEIFDLWYSKDNDEYRLRVDFVAGVQVAFPD